jgi:nicotinate-nucleotide adenylyltransferase
MCRVYRRGSPPPGALLRGRFAASGIFLCQFTQFLHVCPQESGQSPDERWEWQGSGGSFDAMRLGLFGGTFDPIHLGHLILAEQCREACRLDRVWFVVAGAHRIEMARIAIAGHQAFEVSEIEARRPGPHYSVDTLDAVHRERPGDDLFFLIGADSLVDLPTWRDPAGIARLATIVVVNRPGMVEVDPSILPSFGPGTRDLLFVTIPSIGIASKVLRQRLAERRTIRYMVPRGVETYIEAQGLYRGPTTAELNVQGRSDASESSVRG